jgi:hypothetical protein
MGWIWIKTRCDGGFYDHGEGPSGSTTRENILIKGSTGELSVAEEIPCAKC